MTDSVANKESNLPSVFALSMVFGGGIGMVASNLLGYTGGPGFVIGSLGIFLFLAATAIIAHFVTNLESYKAKGLDELARLEREQKLLEEFIEERARAKNLHISADQKQKAVTTVLSALNTAI